MSGADDPEIGGAVIDLETDTLRHIFQLLDARSQSIASTVCRRWLSVQRGLKHTNLELSIAGVPDELVPGFTVWVNRILRGPSVSTLQRLDLRFRSKDVTPHLSSIARHLSACSRLTHLRVSSADQYMDLDWDEMTLVLPSNLQSLDISDVNLPQCPGPFDFPDSDFRYVSVGNLGRFPSLRRLRISCMPRREAGSSYRAAWGLQIPGGLSSCRQLEHVKLYAAFGYIDSSFGMLPADMSALMRLTDLQLMVVQWTDHMVDNICRLPALRNLELVLGVPRDEGLFEHWHKLARCTSLKALSISFDLRTVDETDPAVDGIAVHCTLPLTALPELQSLRVMVNPDNSLKSSKLLKFTLAGEESEAVALLMVDIRLAEASVILPFDTLVHLPALRCLRLHANELNVQPPSDDHANGQASWRGKAVVVQTWLEKLEALHIRKSARTEGTHGLLQCFSMLDGEYHCSIDEGFNADDGIAHLWKGDMNAASAAVWDD